jgi:hypothetical protein
MIEQLYKRVNLCRRIALHYNSVAYRLEEKAKQLKLEELSGITLPTGDDC